MCPWPVTAQIGKLTAPVVLTALINVSLVAFIGVHSSLCCSSIECRVNDMVLDIGMEVADANDPCVTYRCVEVRSEPFLRSCSLN